MFEQLDLQPMVLPEGCGWRRRAALEPQERQPDFDQRYDWDTFAYGAAQSAQGLVLVCPKLFNLEELLRQGSFRSEAGAHPLRRIRRYRRHDEVLLSGPPAQGALQFRAGALEMSCPVLPSWSGAEGRRVLLTTSKDNDLAWIRDWAAHHVRHQGSRAVLVYDNLSGYGAGAVLEVLAQVPGLEAARVVSVPCRYGPLGTGRGRGRAKFLQSGLLNLARLGPLSGASSVLQCDVDELAVSDAGAPGLHEAAERGWLGYATARAVWRGARVGAGQLPRHSDHVMAWSPERMTKEKWCVRPSGLLGGMPWDVHGLSRYQFNRLALLRGTRFFHCQAISTSWKYQRGAVQDDSAFADPVTEAHLRRTGLLD